MTDRHVVVTGLGALASIGLNVPTFWDSLLNRRSGIAAIESFDASEFTSRIGGEIKDFNVTDFMSGREARHLDRFSQLALVAATEAINDSGIDIPACDTTRIGVIVGTGIGGIHEIETQHNRLRDKGPMRVQPFMIPKLMANACSGQIAIRFGLRGPNTAVSAACASANVAIGEAVQAIRDNQADVIVTGGSEAAVTALGVSGFCAARALSRRNDDPQAASRPFDKDRDGFVIGEGAGILVLEELGFAKKRGARIYAEIIGCGMSCDAFDIVQPQPEGLGAAQAMTLALKDAQIAPTEVDYINTHGTSTPLGDIAETKAVKSVLGAHAKNIVANSTKSYIGHLLGASGGVEMIATILQLCHGKIHPTLNLENPDPQCDLDYCPGDVREQKIKTGLSNSFGFGGHNATLVVKRFE